MKQHQYKLTLKHLIDAQGQPSQYSKPLQLEFGNHDDIFSIVERMRSRGDFDENTAAAFAVGLKMFSEVMLEHKDNPLFTEFKPHFMQFMQTLKKGVVK